MVQGESKRSWHGTLFGTATLAVVFFLLLGTPAGAIVFEWDGETGSPLWNAADGGVDSLDPRLALVVRVGQYRTRIRIVDFTARSFSITGSVSSTSISMTT